MGLYTVVKKVNLIMTLCIGFQKLIPTFSPVTLKLQCLVLFSSHKWYGVNSLYTVLNDSVKFKKLIQMAIAISLGKLKDYAVLSAGSKDMLFVNLSFTV